MKERFKIKSIRNDSLVRKIAISFILTSVVPILVIIYFTFFASDLVSSSDKSVKIIIALLIASSMAGLEIVRRIVSSITLINREAKALIEGKATAKNVEVDEDDEVKELALSFNRITKKLQDNIKELESSKAMLQNMLVKVSEAMTSFEDIDKFLNLIVETMSKSLLAERGQLFLVSDDGKKLFAKVSYGDRKEKFRREIAIGEGLIGEVAGSGKSILVPVIANEPSTVAVPLKCGRHIIGVLVVSEKENKQSFNNDDLVLLSDLASQTAAAIENHRLHKDAETTYIQTISALAMAVEARDTYTRGHCKRMAEYSLRLADVFGLDEMSKKLLKDASVLHDVGKIGMSDTILRKASQLSAPEMAIVKEHPKIGENILKPIASLRPLCDVVRHHHEWIDGSGYPDGLKGNEIPLLAKILSVVDAFDAMTSDRPYRKAMSVAQAKKELKKEAGRHFDEEVVDKFLELV